MAFQSFSLKNYLVPSDGTTHAISVTQTASSIPYKISWKDVSQTFQTPFTPQGVYIDATGSTGDVTLALDGIGLSLKTRAGTIQSYSYPALQSSQTVTLTGNGPVTMVFVDYPVLPSTLFESSAIAQNVTINGQPISVQSAATAIGGVPFSVTQTPFVVGSTDTIAASATATAGKAIFSGANGIRIYNDSNDIVFVAFGLSSSIVAVVPATGTSTVNLVAIPAGAIYSVSPGANTYYSLISANATPTGNVYLTFGTGT